MTAATEVGRIRLDSSPALTLKETLIGMSSYDKHQLVLLKRIDYTLRQLPSIFDRTNPVPLPTQTTRFGDAEDILNMNNAITWEPQRGFGQTYTTILDVLHYNGRSARWLMENLGNNQNDTDQQQFITYQLSTFAAHPIGENELANLLELLTLDYQQRTREKVDYMKIQTEENKSKYGAAFKPNTMHLTGVEQLTDAAEFSLLDSRVMGEERTIFLKGFINEALDTDIANLKMQIDMWASNGGSSLKDVGSRARKGLTYKEEQETIRKWANRIGRNVEQELTELNCLFHEAVENALTPQVVKFVKRLFN